MSPEALALIGGIIDRYGLPLALLGFLGWLLLTRRLVLGSELAETVAAFVERLAYVEARRIEERDGRLAAEAALRELAPKTAEAIEAIADSNDRIVDQLEGRTSRARRG